MRLIELALILALRLILAPLAADAQPAGKIYRVGFPAPTTSLDAFRSGFATVDLEGQNVVTVPQPMLLRADQLID
jgi:hypothetical protein